MANKIVLKKSSVAAKVPLTTDLDYGELALNYADEKLYFKNSSNVIKSFNVNATGATLTIGTGLSGTSYNGSTAVTIAIDSTVATLTGTQTLTNKTISGASNTLSNIPNSALTNSSVTVGTTAISLGGSSTTLAGLTSVTSTSFTGALTGNASTATSLAGGSAGTIPYQTAAGTTAMLAAGTSGYFLKSNNTSAPSWVELSLTDLPDAWTKKSVRVATTANITLSGTQTIDGIAVVAGDRVLVKDQTTASQNGIYVVAAGAWTRSTDANTVSKLAGACVNVDSGTANGGFRFDTDLKATDTLDTTALYFFRVYDTGDSATANTANKLVLRDASGNFSASTITAALTGNASTATTLQTARNINGVSFNGSADITITAAAGTLTGTTLNSTVVTSSLTSVGTITTGVWNAGAVTSSGGVQGTTLTSTVATGTAPLTVTSTTKVTNLNAEMVDGYHADTANTASTIAVRDSSNKILSSGFNAAAGMFEHSNTISANYSIASGNNAVSAGPITVANGVTVTIPTGSTWVIV